MKLRSRSFHLVRRAAKLGARTPVTGDHPGAGGEELQHHRHIVAAKAAGTGKYQPFPINSLIDRDISSAVVNFLKIFAIVVAEL